MRREVTLLPSSTAYLSSSGQVDPGSSPYPWNNSPSVSLAQAWADESNDTWWYHWPHKDVGGSDYALTFFEAAPTLIIVRSLKLQFWFSYQQSGPNNWYFPPDNASGPVAWPAIRNRAGSGLLLGTGHEIAGGEIAGANQNVNTMNPYTPIFVEWTLAAHPEGGPWTADDLHPTKFAAGVQVGASAPAFINVQGSFFKIRVHKVRVILSVDDLGGFVENIRHASSLTLRMMRRARNLISPETLGHRAVGAVGSRVYFSHPLGPRFGGLGWGTRRLERRGGQTLKRTYYPGSFRVQDEAFDHEAFRCLLWSAYRLDTPWSPELQGWALLDKGGSVAHDRDQDAWSQRPGDGVVMRVLEDYPNLGARGLAAQGGGDVSVCRRNYDLMQAGWSTVGNSGSFAATSDPTVAFAEEQGYLSSARLEYGGGGGQGGRERNVGTLPFDAGDFVHVRAVVRNTSVPDPETQNLEIQFYRSGGGLPAAEYWDEAGRAWTTTPTNNPIPSDGPSGEVVFDAIPCDAPAATSDPTYYVRIGRFSANLVSCVFHAGLVEVQHGGPGAGDSYGARSPLVLLDADITRLADSHRYPNSLAAELWSYERGVAMVEVQPFWRADALPDAEVKPLIHAQHATDTHDAIQFVAVTGDDDVVRFERAVSGEATFQLDCPIPDVTLTRAHVLRAFARWLGADGWTEYAPYSVEVGYAVFLEADGSLVSSGSVVGALTYTGAMTDRDWVAPGEDETRHADAWIRTLEVRRNPLSGLEAIWRL